MATHEQIVAFARAIRDDNIERVREGLDAGIAIDRVFEPGEGSEGEGAALHFAIDEDSFNVARFLIEKGANVNLKGTSRKAPTPIYRTLNQIKEGGIRVRASLDVNSPAGLAEWNETSEKVMRGRFDLLKLLISRGAQVNEQTSEGRTPLHCTVYASEYYGVVMYGKPVGVPGEKDRMEAAEILLQNGADVNGGRITPLAHARSYHNSGIAQLLASHGGRE